MIDFHGKTGYSMLAVMLLAVLVLCARDKEPMTPLPAALAKRTTFSAAKLTAAKRYVRKFVLAGIAFKWLWPVYYELNPTVPPCTATPHEAYEWIAVFCKKEWNIVRPSNTRLLEKLVPITRDILFHPAQRTVWVKVELLRALLLSKKKPKDFLAQGGYATARKLGQFVVPAAIYHPDPTTGVDDNPLPAWPVLRPKVLVDIWKRKCVDRPGFDFALDHTYQR
jgi:hypothetical protein